MYDTGSLKKPFEIEHSFVDSLTTVRDKQVWIKPHVVPPAANNADKVITEPFWLMRKMAADEGTGSMTLASIFTAGSVLSVASIPCGTGSGQECFAPSSEEIQIKIPVLTNLTDLKKGDELTWAFGERKKRKLAPVKIVEKKAKTGDAATSSDL